MHREFLPVPADGKILEVGDTHRYTMNCLDKGGKLNFNNLVEILNKKERYTPSPIQFYLYKLASICNQFGISKQRTQELILNRFASDFRVKKEYAEVKDFEKFNLHNVEMAYGKYSAAFDSWHKKEDEDQEETPVLPDQIYANLPPFLKGLSSYFNVGRERDVFLLSSLGVLSSCFPAVQGNYNNQMVGMNLYLFISAPASAGKGVMIWARRLGECMHADCENRYRQAIADYEQAMTVYKEAGPESGMPAPIKPQRQLFFVPANSSASKIIQTLMANKNFGVIFETEADTLTQALSNDWGDFSDILRKVFHHEPIELARKSNDEYVSMERSYLSVVLSGTPNQINNLLTSVENGFFSRFLFYDFPLTLEWENVFDRTKESPDGSIRAAAEQILSFSNMIQERADANGGTILFELTSEQEKEFTKMFTEKQATLHHLYGDEIIASIRRLGLVTFRIAMLLTVVRFIKAEVPAQFTCSDTDFQTAVNIANALICHTTKVFGQLQRLRKVKTAKGRKQLYFEKLPVAFNRSGAMEVAALMNIKEKTAENYLAGLIQSGVLERVEHNQYQKTN
ncbi:DUF3987 domain-containing protein [Chitinophaga sp. YIM B06452]|uniref:DUF3987 domain-containing protein n=1 Tax=Chitinophaga sp. YIM B06452 TaxID=3082158 RepID=UPI0031FEC6CD